MIAMVFLALQINHLYTICPCTSQATRYEDVGALGQGLMVSVNLPYFILPYFIMHYPLRRLSRCV